MGQERPPTTQRQMNSAVPSTAARPAKTSSFPDPPPPSIPSRNSGLGRASSRSNNLKAGVKILYFVVAGPSRSHSIVALPKKFDYSDRLLGAIVGEPLETQPD